MPVSAIEECPLAKRGSTVNAKNTAISERFAIQCMSWVRCDHASASKNGFYDLDMTEVSVHEGRQNL